MKPADTPTLLQPEHMQQHQRITAFLPPGANRGIWPEGAGNPCLLLALDTAPDAPAPAVPNTTLCQSWPTAHHKNDAVAVACYTATGNAIQCCGHGLLGAAYFWQKKLQCAQLPLLMNNTLVPSWREQANTWLSFRRLPTSTVATPHWVRPLFDGQRQPIAAAVCGDEQGYLILQWPDNYDLKALVPALSGLEQHSARAMICTSAHPSQGPDVIQLRYFAPQYGVTEDPATGSALRVLADFWSPRFTTLTAHQRSEAGGFLLSRITPTDVHIGGHCTITTMINTDA